jgi:ferrous iron transport protein B
LAHHTASRETEAPPPSLTGETMVLVGNPNVGKSVLFRNLTSRYVTVSNYPGTTVEVVRARATWAGRNAEVIDTPGINDLTPRADDARVTLGLLEEHRDATIVQVADAKNLRRALLLTLQLAELRRPMVLVLNMLDELTEQGGRIDADRLAEILDIPVVTTIAPQNQGTDDLIETLPFARVPRPPERIAAQLAPTGPGTGRLLPVTADSIGGAAAERSAAEGAVEDAYDLNLARLELVKRIVGETYTISPPSRPSPRVRLGFWAMHPLKGLGFLAIVLLAVFWFVGLFGAGTLVDLFEIGGFEQRVSPVAIRAADAVFGFPHEHDSELVSHTVGLPISPAHEIPIVDLDKVATQPGYTITPGSRLTFWQEARRFVHDALVGRFGMITMALSYALAIVLPIVTTFFLVFSILEDSGYFPRLAIMVNRGFRLMGLNGKAVLPMLLGLGCATMATMTTRILETRKERIVTTMLLALAVPCSAQLGVLLAMMAALSPAGAIVWLALVLVVLLLVGWLTARLFDGDTSDFILEIPPMRRPQLSNVLVKTASRLDWYLREVIPIFVFGTAVLFLLDRLSLLAGIGRALQPVVTGLLGLPPEIANAFLVGFLRRDFGAVYILDAVSGPAPLLTPHQILVAMVTITLFMPCFANFLMIGKEHGKKVAFAMAAFIFPFAFAVGGLVNLIGRALGG